MSARLRPGQHKSARRCKQWVASSGPRPGSRASLLVSLLSCQVTRTERGRDVCAPARSRKPAPRRFRMATRRRQTTRQPSQTPTSWHVLVSFAVSFSYVRRRSAHTTQNRQPRSRTLLTYDGLSPADLESVLGQAIPTALLSTSMALDVQRCRSELDELQTELEQWSSSIPPGLDLWRHKLSALISEILNPNHALAMRLAGIRWSPGSGASSTRQRRNDWYNPPGADEEAFRLANRLLSRSLRPYAGSWLGGSLRPTRLLMPPSTRSCGSTCGAW